MQPTTVPAGRRHPTGPIAGQDDASSFENRFIGKLRRQIFFTFVLFPLLPARDAAGQKLRRL
jgi:hypothetical protein